MEIYYNEKTDLLYLRLDPRRQELRNEDLTAGIVLDIGEGDRIAGIEILDASRHVNLDALLPVDFRPGPARQSPRRGPSTVTG